MRNTGRADKSGKSRGSRRNRGGIVVLIVLMLAMTVCAAAWLARRGIVNNRIRTAEEIAELALSAYDSAKAGADQDYAAFAAAEHVYSHRGREGAKEHSFEVYDEAIAAGSHYLELDIVLSRDGTIYVSHDLTAKAMTGSRAAYADMTDAEIDALRTHAGKPILRLADVFRRYGRSVYYIVEFKTAGRDLTDAFGSVTEETGVADRLIVQSFYSQVLRELEKVYPDVPKLLLCRTQAEFNRGLDIPYVNCISVKLPLMTERNRDLAHERGKRFSAWTMNYEYEIRRAIELGVDNYFTNDTETAIRLERELRK